MKVRIVIFTALIALAGCDGDETDIETDIDQLARDYLFLELSMGLHDPAHVDAYFGPEDIERRAQSERLPLDDIRARAREMQDVLEEELELLEPDDETGKARVRGLIGRLEALRARAALGMGEALPFDEESLNLFGTTAPDYDAAHFQAILDDIDALIGGEGALPDRVSEFRNQFVIPPERLAAVFDAAIDECRRRTLQHIDLPRNESFSIEYVNDKPWSGYNWYQGDSVSLIQINTDLPIFISRAVDLGCHEGYPGHHTFNALLEQRLVREKDWVEFTLYPLFSPQSLIAEGSGNYGIELAFPNDERNRFEKEVLFPLADLDPADADRYYELLELLARLDYAGNEAARDYLNGTIDRQAAVDWLVRYALTDRDRAEQRVDFFDTYRSYVINYNLGKDLVAEYVEQAGDDQGERWRRFETLLSTPVSAADLR